MTPSDIPEAHAETADVGVERLAKVYAEALYAAAESEGGVDAILEEFDSLLDDLFSSEPRLEVLFSGAAVGRNARREVLERAFAGRASTTFTNFLYVLNDHERLELLRPVRRALHALYDERHNRLHVYVTTAVPIEADQRDRIADAVRLRFKKEPVMVTRVDPSILGGLKVRVGDRQLDASVRTRLDNLRTEILARCSHEIQSRRDHFSTDRVDS